MSASTSSLHIKTESGVLAGAMASESVRVFKGIPYAAAPVGPLRWRAPRPAAKWEGVRRADDFGPDCPQPSEVESRAPHQSEDCLYLNVWSPAGAEPGSLPVMVWIHGGSFLFGSGAEPILDGALLASRGAVVVTINYRLGLFGFLAHPALTRESAHGSSSNYGLMDQIMALTWIRANIEAFGGDARRITAFGVSAGSASLSLLLASPQGAGLFDRAILESAGAGRNLSSLAEAESAGALLGGDIEALRALSQSEVLQRVPLFAPKVRGLTLPRVLRPIRDGWLLPEDERPVFLRGDLHKVPLIIGTNADEGSEFVANWPVDTMATYRELVELNFGDRTDEAMAVYPAAGDAQVKGRVAEMFADTQFNYGTRLLAQAMATAGMPVWRYVFARRRPGQTDGPHHCDELPYVFGNFPAAPVQARGRHDQVDRNVHEWMVSAWLAFASNGAPGMDEWPSYDPAGDRHLTISERPDHGRHWRKTQLDFLEDFYEVKQQS
jgi:para-nitrobenzyl esterase